MLRHAEKKYFASSENLRTFAPDFERRKLDSKTKIQKSKFHTVGVVQLVRAPDCGSGGRGFEPLLPPRNKSLQQSRCRDISFPKPIPDRRESRKSERRASLLALPSRRDVGSDRNQQPKNNRRTDEEQTKNRRRTDEEQPWLPPTVLLSNPWPPRPEICQIRPPVPAIFTPCRKSPRKNM